MSLLIKKLSPNATLPQKGSQYAAGFDLCSCGEFLVSAHGKNLIKTGIAIKIPPGHYGRIAPRSGLALKNHIDMGAGVIDEDYRGEIGVLIFNHSDKDFKVTQGDRVAQLIIEQITYTDIIEVDELDETLRGDGGFGSTGVDQNINSKQLKTCEYVNLGSSPNKKIKMQNTSLINFDNNQISDEKMQVQNTSLLNFDIDQISDQFLQMQSQNLVEQISIKLYLLCDNQILTLDQKQKLGNMLGELNFENKEDLQKLRRYIQVYMRYDQDQDIGNFKYEFNLY